MKNYSLKFKTISACLIIAILSSSCSSTTLIRSSVQPAKVYINGEYIGQTPCYYSDTKIVGSTSQLRLEREGYETLETVLTRNEAADVGAIIGGIFVWIPFLWTMKYKPEHNYELRALSPHQTKAQSDTKNQAIAAQLDDLRKKYDDGRLSKEDYETQKKKLLGAETN